MMRLLLTDAHGTPLFWNGNPDDDAVFRLSARAASESGLCTVCGEVYCIRPIFIAGKRYRLCFTTETFPDESTALLHCDSENIFAAYAKTKRRFAFAELLELIARAAHERKSDGVKIVGDLHTVMLETSPVLCALCLLLWMRLCRPLPLSFAADGERLSLTAARVPPQRETAILETLLAAASAAAGFSFSIGDGGEKYYLLDFHPIDPALYGFKAESPEKLRAVIERLYDCLMT